jgi:hypothetical protein
LDYANLTIMEALPDYLHGPSGGQDVFRRLAGAKIIRIGSTQEDGIEGGGLVLDYELDSAAYRLVFGLSELGMWIVYDSFTCSNRAEFRG